MNFDIQTIVRTTPLSAYQRGKDAYFLRINSDWGIKFFEWQQDRDKTYHHQLKAARMGLAPQVGDRFDAISPGDVYVYGYVTECISNTYLEGFYPDQSTVEDIDWDSCQEALERDEEYIYLMGELEKIGLDGDMHCENVGWMKNGVLVAIDFSREQ